MVESYLYLSMMKKIKSMESVSTADFQCQIDLVCSDDDATSKQGVNPTYWLAQDKKSSKPSSSKSIYCQVNPGKNQ